MSDAAVIELRAAHWPDDEAALASVRRTVFIEEQAVPEALEWDGEDAAARHWLALVDGKPIGTVRLRAGGHIGRMAVLKEYRSAGVGSMLLLAAVAAARDEGLVDAHLHAQVHALAFYARHGFVAEGEVFMDAGIPHREMLLRF